MTREEAIEGLYRILGNYYRVCNEHLLKEIDVAEEINSLNMAIEALEQPTADVIPIEYHDRCMELEIKKRANMVEVVRCKDCVYYENFLCGRFSAYGDSVEEPEYDYCSYGERRSDEH